MYVCQICHLLCGPGEPQLKYVTYRFISARGKTAQQVATETPVCKRCKDYLDLGMSLSALQSQQGQPRPI
jgi:hypothetical protein